jgi:S-DNA-T family DNA segregation ATPase FtsK/SpoIIIE
VSSHANARREIRLVEPKRHEVLGLLCLASAALLALSLASFDARGGADWIGPLGARVAESLVALLGTAAVLIPWALLILSLRLFRRTTRPVRFLRLLGTGAIIAAVATALHLWFGERPALGGLIPGGLLGSTLGESLRATVGTVGANTVVLTALLVALVVRTRLSLVGVASSAKAVGSKGTVMLRNGVGSMAKAIHEERSRRRADETFDDFDDAEDRPSGDAAALLQRADAPAVVSPEAPAAQRPVRTRRLRPRAAAPEPEDHDDRPSTPPAPPRIVTGDAPAPAPAVTAAPAPVTPHAPPQVVSATPRTPRARRRPAAPATPDDETPPWEEPSAIDTAPETPAVPEMVEEAVATAEAEGDGVADASIVRHDHEIAKAMKRATVKVEKVAEPPPPVEMEMPGIDLLAAPPAARVNFDEAQLRGTADKLIKTLADYVIDGKVMEIHPGPVVTTYEVLPAAGTKLAKIARLSDDIAMSLEASKVRIVAPIPGKGRVGFEIPNAQRQMVTFRELVDTEAFKSLKGALPVAIGKDVVGAPYFADLATMPHLIIAGATGQGKSVGLNVMLTSLLYKRSPDDVKLLMVDPKVVELAVYDNIPHMLLPVVTDMKKATLALRWVVDEMERRYQLFAQTGARNINTYNERVARAIDEGVPLKGLDGPVRTKRTGTTMELPEVEGESADITAAKAGTPKPVRLPYILVVVDEFADLIMVAGKDIEAAVARLAQKARAAGIHVILATQRPSVDVITGMIKANFPARIAFKVSQKVDSRTILDQQGAEHLLGRGDMLILPPGSSDLRRVHCAYVSEEEVQRVTDHWRAQGRPHFDEDILRPREDDEAAADDGPAEIKVPADKYEKAVQLVTTSRKCSTSYVQRYLGIGYNVAARIVDKMEREGIVGAPKGPGKEREVIG